MKMWKKIRKSNKKKRPVPPRLSSLPKVVHILSSRPKNNQKAKVLQPASAMDARKKQPEIAVPALPFSRGRGLISDENPFLNRRTWESIDNSNTPVNYNDDEQLSVLTNENYRVFESRQDSFSASSRKVSFVEDLPREAPPEAARSKVLPRSFQAKTPRRFGLRPKSIVRKWNQYADMEDKGLSASPRHRTKLARSLHLELEAAVSSDSNDDYVADSTRVDQAVIQESCSNRDLQEYKAGNEIVTVTESHSMTVGKGSLTTHQTSCADRCVQVESTELTPEDHSVSSIKANRDAPALMICKDDIQRITESGFPVSVFDKDDRMDDPSTKVTVCTTFESESASVSSFSDNESISFNHSMPEDPPNERFRQEEIVTLSLAQILVQSYQPDPDNPGYWKKKGADIETKSNPPTTKSFLRKNSPLPTLNTFLAEVKARRNEIFTKSDEPQMGPNDEPDPNVDWYGAKRQKKRENPVNHGPFYPSPKDILAELKSKQRKTVAAPISRPIQKRVVVCQPSAGSANDLLSELKAKQQEIRQRRTIQLNQEANTNEAGTGFLPDLMTELKSRQREMKSRPTRQVDSSACNESKASNQGIVGGLKAKQRAIEERFYKRLVNFQNSLRGNEVVVIPEKS